MQISFAAVSTLTVLALGAAPYSLVVEAKKDKKAKKESSSDISNNTFLRSPSLSGGLSQNQILDSLNAGGVDSNTNTKNSKKGKSNKTNLSSSSPSLSGEPALLTGTNVPSPGVAATKSDGTFDFRFSSSLNEMDYELEVNQDDSFSTSQVVDGAALFCGDTSAVGADNIKLADIEFDFNPGDSVQSTIHSAVGTKNGFVNPAISCEGIAVVSTVAGLYAAILNGDVFMEVEVFEDGETKLIRSQLSLDETPQGSSGSTFANYASILDSEKADIGDRGASALFEFSFDLAGEMVYQTSGSDTPAAFVQFINMGLYCGDAGDPTETATKIVDLTFNPSGATAEGRVQSIELDVTCNDVAISTVEGLQAAIVNGNVFFRAKTTTDIYIRGQVYPNNS